MVSYPDSRLTLSRSCQGGGTTVLKLATPSNDAAVNIYPAHTAVDKAHPVVLAYNHQLVDGTGSWSVLANLTSIQVAFLGTVFVFIFLIGTSVLIGDSSGPIPAGTLFHTFISPLAAGCHLGIEH